MPVKQRKGYCETAKGYSLFRESVVDLSVPLSVLSQDGGGARDDISRIYMLIRDYMMQHKLSRSAPLPTASPTRLPHPLN